jgi:hypothetical protein
MNNYKPCMPKRFMSEKDFAKSKHKATQEQAELTPVIFVIATVSARALLLAGHHDVPGRLRT